jgi:hypothetical protein
MYNENATGYIHFECSSGLTGQVNDGITMNIVFTSANLSCSTPCNSELYQSGLPCGWSNFTWNETTGTCTGIIDKPTPSDTGSFCCVIDNVLSCVNLSVVNERSDTTSVPPLPSPHTHGIIMYKYIAGAVGVFLVMLVIVITIVAVYIRKKIQARGYVHVAAGGAHAQGGNNRPVCGGQPD